MISYNLLTDTNISTVTADASDRTVTISDLAPFTVYEISVVAVTIVAGPATTINVQTEQAGLETIYTSVYSDCVYTYLLIIVHFYTYGRRQFMRFSKKYTCTIF